MTVGVVVGVVVGLRAEAALIPPRLGWRVAVAGGTSAAGAEQAARVLIAGGATALLSFGLAGGLDPDVSAGAILVPREVIDENGQRYPTDPALRERLGDGAPGSLLTQPSVVAGAAEKAAVFASTGCVAVDLESGAVARVAAASGVGFAALRAVCDPAWRSLSPAALVALDGGRGAIGLGRVAMSVLAQPGQIPDLLRLARDAAVARRALLHRLRAVS